MRELPACDFVLTGATGFLGGAVLQRLLLRGLRATAIRCLVRDRARALAQGIPADCVFCADLANPADSRALAAAVEGAGVVLHLAGAVKAWNRSGFEGPNVDGTRRLLAAVVISPIFLLGKSRKHFLTVGYMDEEGKQQALIFRVDKNGIRTALVSLEARTGLKIQYQDEEARKAGKG